jgi:hypothetical protein
MRTQISNESSGPNRIVLCNAIADLLKIDRRQRPDQQLH